MKDYLGWKKGRIWHVMRFLPKAVNNGNGKNRDLTSGKLKQRKDKITSEDENREIEDVQGMTKCADTRVFEE